MKKVFGILSVILAGAASMAFAADLNVYVRTPAGVAIAGARVVAVAFGPNGPDSANTKTGITDANGLAAFNAGNLNALTDDTPYDVFAATQGYLPSLSDQFNDPEHPRLRSDAAIVQNSTVTLDNAGVTNVGQIVVDVENASPNTLIFGEIKPASGYDQEAIARGWTITDGAGFANNGTANGPIRILNVPYVSTTAYSVNGFDPLKNKGYGFPGNQELAAYRPLVRYTSLSPDPLENNLLNFANAITHNNTQNLNQQFGTTGDVSVTGALVDTTTAESPIPYMGVNFSYLRDDPFCQGCTGTSNIWANVDTNGRFDLYGLQQNTSYYAQIYGGCSWNGQTSACYDGYNSTWTAYSPATSAPLGLNDFYYGATPIIKKLKLNRASGGSGTMSVYVKDNLGNFLPQVGVGLWPDGMQWETNGTICDGNQANNISQPGLANFNGHSTTGYVLIENLPAGNYSLQAWTQFSQQGGTQFNAGPDGQFSWGGNNCPSDDFRLTIDTTTPGSNARVYNAVGALLQSGSSITITITVVPQTSGKVKGTLTFPSVVDLTNDPINITLQPQCQPGSPCSGGGYHIVTGSTGPIYSYEVNVASGQAYWMNVTSNYWGRVRIGEGGNNQINLASTATARVDMTFAPAGRIVGKLYKPGNVLFTPTFGGSGQNSQANINFDGENSWGWGQVNQDGSFAVGGLLPGKYKVKVQGWGSFAYTDPSPVPEVTIVANQDAYKDLNVVDGVAVRMNISTATLPVMNKPSCTGEDSWDCPPESWTVMTLPRGTDLSEKIASILVNEEEQSEFAFVSSTSTSGGRCGGPSGDIGFCIRYQPSPSVADFYLLRKGQFDSDNVDAVRPYFIILNSTKGVQMNKSLVDPTPYFWLSNFSTVNVMNINLTPPDLSAVTGALGQATLKGAVVGSNIIRQVDFSALGGDFNNFMKYIPTVTLYDSSGTFRAAGLVVPNPTCFAHGSPTDIQLEQSIADGNWTLFKSIFDSCPGGWGYEIRGLNAGKAYKAILTTPNYPPYDNKVTLGAAGSTTTLNINLDLDVGSGATLQGVVMTTNNVVIANAQVSIRAEGYNNGQPKVFTTGSNGSYKFEGLPEGTFKISVVATDYGLAVAKLDISGNSTFTKDISLTAAGASIKGTVVAKASRAALGGAKVFAYNDTLNVNDPSAELPLYDAETSTSGYYTLEGLTVGDVYKISVRASGYYVASASTRTIAGVRSGIDFEMVKKPLDVRVYARQGQASYDFTVLNPQDFSDGQAWVSQAPFALAGSTEVTNNFHDETDSKGNKWLVLNYPLADLAANADYTLRIKAVSGVTITGVVKKGDVILKDVLFGLNRKGCANQSIDDTMLGDSSPAGFGHNYNQAPLEVSEDNVSAKNASAMTIPAGSMIGISTYVVPAFSFCQQDTAVSTFAAVQGSTAAFASSVYQVSLSSLNLTNKGFDMTLGYDLAQSNLTDVAIYHFDNATAKWETVPGAQTINAGAGTITTRVRSLSSVLGLKNNHPMQATAMDGQYVPNARYGTLATSDSGSFAIMRPSLVGAAYSGTILKVFNFPNPFNLSAKTVNIVHGGATTSLPTTGTIIKYELPTGTNGHVWIRIYTLAGELVDEIDEGNRTGGSYFYTTWDGKNGKGHNVANGIYYGVLSVPGQKAKAGTFKLAVIK